MAAATAPHRRLAALASQLSFSTSREVEIIPAATERLGPLIGYVSDERYLAVAGCSLELIADGSGGGTRYATASTATGSAAWR